MNKNKQIKILKEALKKISQLIDFYDFDEDGDGYIGQLHEIEEITDNALKDIGINV